MPEEASQGHSNFIAPSAHSSQHWQNLPQASEIHLTQRGSSFDSENECGVNLFCWMLGNVRSTNPDGLRAAMTVWASINKALTRGRKQIAPACALGWALQNGRMRHLRLRVTADQLRKCSILITLALNSIADPMRYSLLILSGFLLLCGCGTFRSSREVAVCAPAPDYHPLMMPDPVPSAAPAELLPRYSPQPNTPPRESAPLPPADDSIPPAPPEGFDGAQFRPDHSRTPILIPIQRTTARWSEKVKAASMATWESVKR